MQTAMIHPTETASINPMNMKSERVLIVDDEANIRLMLRTTLSTEGYGILEAANGREALEMIERETPEVMLLDLAMPELDGIGVLQGLRRKEGRRWPKVIVLTAYGSIPTAVEMTRLGAVDFLEKPASPREVREAVEAATSSTTVVLPMAEDPVAGGYEAVLTRIRKALRAAKFSDAESLLMRAADLAHKDASYFNLLGVLYESQHEWRLAKKFYGKAIAANRHYEPAQQNMRRIYELYAFGRSDKPIGLGDDSELLAMLAS